ncbi:ATP-binding protein [Micromonospora sp. URMC 103]|uniref:ATP-binding protein n=1 Tax=Micromonospora sp. URMC 103 TaxID=3423406 RepID=UPI003F1DBE1E
MDGDTLLSARITAPRVSELRQAVTAATAAAGLTGSSLEDFVLAVHELVANVVRHGGGVGELQLSRSEDMVTCRISDQGPGMPAHAVHTLPDPRMPAHRGLWLVQRLGRVLPIL